MNYDKKRKRKLNHDIRESDDEIWVLTRNMLYDTVKEMYGIK